MARYRLTKAHYLRTDPPTEWEQREQSQQTGREVRTRVEVPMWMDEGTTISTTQEGAFLGSENAPPDIVVVMATPSNEMQPLDAEAEAALEKMLPVWAGKSDPVESLPMTVDMSALGAVAVAKPKPTVRRRF